MIPLVLLPGTLCDERMWQAQIAGLVDIASSTVADLSQDNSLHALAQRVLSQAPARFAVAGFSMGAVVAFELFRQAPERISHFAILDGKPDADTQERTQQRLKMIEYIRAHSMETVLNELLLPHYFHPANQNDPELIQLVTDMAHSFTPAIHERQIRALLDRPDSRPLLSEIKVPALTLAGEADRLCPPEWHRDMAARMANAECVIVPKAGHFVPLEQPEAVTAAMRIWLSQ